MVGATGDLLPYPPPPDFPPPPTPVYETSLGSEVDRMMETGAQTWATSAPSANDDGVGVQVKALGAQSVSGNSVSGAQVVAPGGPADV